MTPTLLDQITDILERNNNLSGDFEIDAAADELHAYVIATYGPPF